MTPLQIVPNTMPTVTEELPQNMGAYSQVSMPSTAATNFIKREQDYGPLQYDRNGIPLTRVHQRHTSMPTYMEYSPAPSFVSSQYEDYSQRGLSYEPVTPPQHAQNLAEPAYIANEDTGLYTAIPENPQSYNPMINLPTANLSGGQYNTTQRYPSSNVYSVIEGSPTYKQRRRRSSIPPNVTNGVTSTTATATGAMPHAPHRQSDLRRSVSASVGPEDGGDGEHNSPQPGSIPINGFAANLVQQHKEMLDHMSRHTTPLPTLEGSPAPQNMGIVHPQQDNYNGYQTDNMTSSMDNSPVVARGDRPGPVRRARSATLMELGPYPHKSHSCPIPTCGRLFKRLEHLKRYVAQNLNETFPFLFLVRLGIVPYLGSAFLGCYPYGFTP